MVWNNYLLDQLWGSTWKQFEIYALISWSSGLSLFTSPWEFNFKHFETYIIYSLFVVNVKTIPKSHNHKVKGHLKWSRCLITFSIWVYIKYPWMCIFGCLADLSFWEVDGLSYVGHSFITSFFVYIKTNSTDLFCSLK